MATQLTSAGIQGHEVVSPNEWIASRKELLRKEKECTKLRDELSRQRRELPWEKVEKQYVFDGPNGKETLADLFDGKNQLIVYHFMFGPGWEEGCPSCSFVADHFDGSLVHLANRDVTLVVVSRAPLAQIEAFKKRMGLAFQVGVIVRERLQSRLPRVVHQGGDGETKSPLQLRHRRVRDGGGTWR